MTQVLSLYQEAEARRIPLFLRALPQTGSLSLLSPSGQCYIALDPSLSDTQQRVRLAHELGHCETGSFYNRYSPYDLRERCEHHRAADPGAGARRGGGAGQHPALAARGLVRGGRALHAQGRLPVHPWKSGHGVVFLI